MKGKCMDTVFHSLNVLIQLILNTIMFTCRPLNANFVNCPLKMSTNLLGGPNRSQKRCRGNVQS